MIRTYPPKSKWKLINTTIFPELENKTNEFLKDLLECKRSLKKIIKVSENYKIKDFENVKKLYRFFCIQKGCKKKNNYEGYCNKHHPSYEPSICDKSLNNQKETDGIKLLISLLGKDFPYNIIKNCEFASADLLANKKGKKISYHLDHLYKGIQIKTSSVRKDLRKREYVGFYHTENYDNMLIIGICVSKERFWFFNGNDINVTAIKIPLKNKKSKYKKNEITKEKVRDELLNWLDNDERLPYKTYEYLSKPKEKGQLKEFYTFRSFLRQLENPNIKWKYPEIECTAIDIIYQNEWGNVQHKNACIAKKYRGLQVICSRPNTNQPYNIKDGIDNFIIFATKYDKTKESIKRYVVVGYWVFPINILVEKGFIANEKQKGKKCFYVSPSYEHRELVGLEKECTCDNHWTMEYYNEFK